MKTLNLFLFCTILALAVSCTKTTTPYSPTVVTNSFSDSSITYQVQVPTLNNPFMAHSCDLTANVVDYSGHHTDYYVSTSDAPSTGTYTTLEQTIQTTPQTKEVWITLYNRQTCKTYFTILKSTSSFKGVVNF